MKIVCLIKPYPQCIYFVNNVYRVNQDVEVILERQRVLHGGIVGKIRKNGIRRSARYFVGSIVPSKKEQKINSYFFGDQWLSLDKNIPCMEVPDINSDVVRKHIQNIKPDLMLDHGTSIVKHFIFEQAKLALNLHWGLSPYYRGTHCTDWALINWDPYNIGVTIHKLSKEIDGGSVLAQKRAVITRQDSVYSINMRLTYLGVEMIKEIIGKINRGELLEFKSQDYSLGYLTYMRQWGAHMERMIRYIERNDMVSVMLEYPARSDELSIFELS